MGLPGRELTCAQATRYRAGRPLLCRRCGCQLSPIPPAAQISPPIASHAEREAAWASPQRIVPRLRNNRLPILPCPWQTCLLPLWHCPLRLTGSCPSPRGQHRPLRGLRNKARAGSAPHPRRKRNWPESPAETQQQGHPLHPQASNVIWPRASLHTALTDHTLFSPSKREI